MFKGRLRQEILDTGITGEIPAHTQVDNNRAVKGLLALDPYYTFGIKAVERAVESEKIDFDDVLDIFSQSLGITSRRFMKKGPSYINPDLTYQQLNLMLAVIDDTIAQGKSILLGTGHPGSLMKFYLRLESYIEKRGGKLYSLKKSAEVPGKRAWIDAVRSVVVQSDLGSLQHTHDFKPMDVVLDKAKGVGLVVSDHGFAGAAINRGIKTVGLHDVDDPAIPLAHSLGLNVVCVPMNDNQLNLSTDRALSAVIESRG